MNAEYSKSVREGLVDEDGIIKLDFIKNSKYPQMIANEMNNATPKLSQKQARSFYNVVNEIYINVIMGSMPMKEAIVELTMLSSRVNDKLNKGSVSEDFKEFIEMNVEAVTDEKSLKAFVLHFEAVYNNLKEVNAANNRGYNGHNGNGGHNNNGRYNNSYNNSRPQGQNRPNNNYYKKTR